METIMIEILTAETTIQELAQFVRRVANTVEYSGTNNGEWLSLRGDDDKLVGRWRYTYNPDGVHST
jgi:hypothetical protein